MKNATPPGVMWCKVVTEESGTFPNVKVTNTPIQCMHCQNPPCVESCPTGSRVKTSNGIIATDQDKCIGCEECLRACPYDVQCIINYEPYYPEFGFTPFEEKGRARFKPGAVGKCDFCQDFVADGKKPACVEVCPSHVREFGDLNDSNDAVSKLIIQRPVFRLHLEKGTEPSVFYLGRNK
jgi:molybdopterin-containing oxidoreductase family iron-sulfur binding subunit